MGDEFDLALKAFEAGSLTKKCDSPAPIDTPFSWRKMLVKKAVVVVKVAVHHMGEHLLQRLVLPLHLPAAR